MSRSIIEVEGLSKLYELGTIGGRTLRDSFERQWYRLRGKEHLLEKVGARRRMIGPDHPQAGPRPNTMWALKDVSFSVNEGEVLGIIGKNGAGKSTLLKILTRITEPTSGRAVLNGRVASLLEVGTGFHPELTGRENIYLSGAILGMKKAEINSKFDEIVAFSEIGQYLDTPVKRYSSGMYVRLAFAVAAHLEPEILLVDEVLAVGDAEFQRKCLGKMSAVARGGRTVLFVSHNMASMTALCSRAILVDAGRVVLDGPTDATIRGYLTSVNKASNTRLADRTDRRGTGPLKFLEAWVEDEQGNRVDVVQSGNRVSIVAVYASDGSRAIRSPYIAFSVRDSAGRPLTDLQNHASSPDGGVFPASGRVKCTIPRLPLNEGDYYFSAYCSVDRTLSDHVVNAGKFRVSAGDFFGTGKVPDTRFPVFFQQTWHVEGR